MRLPRGLVTAVCVVILAAAVVEVPLPVFVERPLEPLELGEALVVDGVRAAELDGSYHVGLVGRRRATTLRAVAALARGDERLRAEEVVVPSGVDDATHFALRRDEFTRSVEAAGAAALRLLGRSVPYRVGGVTVIDVVADSPADGTLSAADVIVSADGEPVTAPSDLREMTRDADEPVALVVERGGEARRVELAPGAFEARGREQVGLGVVTTVGEPRVALPLDLEVDAGGVGGPSAGLVIAVAVYDLLEADVALADGRRVAGTGRVTAEGRVRSVSAVPAKVAGAVAAGADVFVVPESQRRQAERAADGQLEVVGAQTLADAVEALGARAGRARATGW